MDLASTDQANFSLMLAAELALKISKVKHKTFLEVNEEGTETAAVTSVGTGLTNAGPLAVFRLNRPFLFLLLEKATNTTLIYGAAYYPLAG